MKYINKTIYIPEPMGKAIAELAKREKRSFTKEAEELLESALGREKELKAIRSGKTQIDPALLGGRWM